MTRATGTAGDKLPDLLATGDGRGRTAPQGGDTAPFIMLDHVAAWGICDGVAGLTLEARQLHATPAGLQPQLVVTAHLRASLPALFQLRDAINAVELLARQQSNARPN